MATSALQVIKFCYHTLVASLPLEDINFLAVLEKHNLLGDAKSSVESMPTREERASYFLDNLMKQELEKNNVTGFYNLITIMANSKSDSLTKLAADISSAVKVKHEVITNRNNATVLGRLKNGDKSVKLADIQLCSEAKDSRPELKHLHNLVSPYYAASWRKIGHYLGLEDGRLDIIDHDYHHRAEECCDAVLKEWLDTDPTGKWNKVINAIDSPVVLLSTVTNQLQQYYVNDKSSGSSDNWPFHQPDNFTSVALIHHKHKRTVREVIAVASVMHKGKVTINNDSKQLTSHTKYLAGCQTNKDLSELFCSLKVDKEVIPTRILIEGAPGIGKTILSKQIAFEWATSKLLMEKELLFLIILRDPNVQKIKTLEQFVFYAIKASEISSTVKSVAQYLEDTSGEHCTIVFDGYDELSEERRSDSFVAKIIKHEILKLCSVVITSRHSASSSLHGDVDCRVEILGFTKEKRDEYIYLSLRDDHDRIKKIKDYLMVNPFIDGLCYIPLNMAILICLILESDTADLPNNQTEINDQFTVVAISRYLKKEHNIEYPERTLQSLPEQFKEQFEYLCELAYIFLGKDKIVFDDNDIRKHCPKLCGKWSTLGLLNTVKYHGFMKGTPLTSYNFLHFSIQEFLAAYHIYSLNDKKEIKILKSNFWNPRYLNASVMYVGLTKGNGFALQHFLSGHKFPIVTKLFGSKRIAANTTNNKLKCLHLLQCFSEAGNDKLIQQLGSLSDDKTIDLSGYALLAKDIQTLSFFFARSTANSWEVLNLSKCYMGDNTFDLFCKMLSDFSEKKVIILFVDLSYNHFTHASLIGIVDLIYCFNVKCLSIHDNSIDKDSFDDALYTVSLERKTSVVLQVDDYDHYFINHVFSEEISIFPGFQSNLLCNYHFWNCTFHLKYLHSIVESSLSCINSLSVYNKFVNDADVAKTSQKLAHLDQIKKVEYVLQSHNRLHASNTSMVKTMQAFNEFLANHQEVQADDSYGREQWKIVSFCCCINNDKPIIGALKYCFQQCTLYIDTLTISECQVVTTDTIFEILRYSIVKNLIVMNNEIDQHMLSNVMLNDVIGESQLLNFKFGVPLIIANNFDLTDERAQSQWHITKYFVNCRLDDSFETTINCEDSSFTYELIISNCGFNEDKIETVLLLSENPYMHITMCERKIKDEVGFKLLKHFHKGNKDKHRCIFISDVKLMAYGVTELQINKIFDSTMSVNSAILLNCSLTELAMFKVIPEYWDIIDLSGSNIGDRGIEKLCEHFSCCAKRVLVKHFNVSNNSLTSSPLTNLLQFCIVENLIVSHNNFTMDDDEQYSFNETLQCAQCILGNICLNFLQEIPLVVTDTAQNYIYLTMSPIDLTTIQDSICKSWQHCSIFYFVKHLPERLYINCTHQEIKHCVTLSYTNSVLNFKTVKVKSNDKVTKTVISILLGGLLESGHTISSIDLFNCGLEDSVCSLLCKSIFNDKFKLDCIEELDLSSNRTTEYFIDSIIESFRYCIIKKLIVSFSNFTVLDGFAKDLFTAYSTQKRLLNVIHGVPFSVINHREVNEPTPFSESVINFEEDEEDLYSCFDNDIGDQTWESHIITFFVNCRIDSDTIKKGVLCDLQTDLKFTKLYKFHIYDSFKKSSNPLEELVSILSLQIVNNLVIHEVNLPDRLVRETLNILIQLGGGICYVLTSKTMIHAYNASIYQILAAVQQISFINSMQPVLIEQPVYMNNASPTNISCHWQCIDLNNCNITDEELYKLHTYFCNDTIRLLNLSNNNLSLPAIFSFILNCRFVQNLHFDGRYSEFHLCETLFGLFPSSIFTRDLQIEVRFKKSTAFILCGSQLCESHSCIDDFLATAIASSESIHFLMINCSFHMQDNNFIHVLHGFSLASNLSSLHIHNASLQFHHLLSVIEILLHVKLFIVEKDFVFTNNNYSENYHNHVKNFFSGECARVEITWHSAYEGVTAFIFKEMTLFKDAMKMTSILKGTASIHRFSISNVYVNDDLAEDVAMLISMDTLSVVKLANLSLSGQQMMLIHKSLEFSTSLIHLEINHTNAVNYYQDELFSIVAKKQNTNFLIIEKELVFTNYSHTKSFFAQKGIRFEVQPVHFTVSIIREMATINYAIKMKTLLKETKTLSSFSILNACMTDDQAEDVALLLSTESDNLTKVELMKLNLSGKQLMIILTSLQDTNSLSHLVINSINVVNHCQDELFSIIAGNENLSHLEISNCNLKEATVIKITEAIFIISESLRCLILSCNNISDIAAAKLATTLRKTNFLIHLDLSSTNLQAQGITSIAQSLRQNTWLYSFCISNCNLPKQTVEDIVSCVLDDSKSLSCLEMSNCKLEETLILDITTALTKISSLHTLDLSLNKITDIAAANLAAVITWNQNIECLRLSMNGLNETSVFNVLTSCKVLSKLTCVDLDFAHVSAPVSEGSSNIYLSIDDIIEGVAINNNDCDGTYEYITLMNDIRQLTHLTLSNCSYMEMFSALVALSSLEHLDVNSSKIPFTAISTTIENNTSLKHINISNCSLQDHMFHEIAKAMSTLTELRHLNISGIRIANKAAGFVAATITRNPAIYHLDLSKCQLQSNGLMKIVKQLINLRQLSYLDVSYNYFTAEAANELASTFTRSFELEHLCLSHCNLCEQSFLSIVKSLASMNAIRHLNLSSNIINSETTIVLSGCIANNSNLEYLDLSNCYSTVSENYIEKVTSSLKLLSSIKHLNISSTNLNDSAVDDLAFAINNNTGLECINFSNCKVQGNGMLKILQKLLQAYTLKCINLQGSTIHTKQVNTRSSKNLVTILVRIITNNKSLEHINMSNCELSTLEVKSIMKAHSVLSNLIHIKISQNSVNTKAADEIASVITNNKSLEVLDFSCCDMGGDSMTTVVDTLAQCMHLRVVNLSNNIITEETTTKLALSLCNNATLEHLDVSCCSLECSQFFATLSTSAQFYFKLKHLNLSSNKITYRASCDLHSFLAVSGMTEHLDLSDCSLTENDDEDGLYIVLSALQNSNSLKHLNLQSNKFTEKAACALYNVVCVNQNLDFLNLNQCDVPEFLLGDILKQCRLLTLLDIGHNVVTDETAYLLSCAVSNGILKYLNIEDCILQEDGTEILVDAMTYGTNMEYIVAEEYMEHTTTGAVISDISILIFKFGISSYNPLAGKIDSVVVKPVYYFKLTSDCLLEDMIDIIESVFDMESIEYFNVSCCDLRDHNFYLILQAMKNSSTLKYLQLKSSSIPDEGLSSIVSAISSSTIVHTDFSDCNLLESQVSLVVKGLVTLSNLKYLNVSDNKISIEATNDIAEVITNNKSLQYLSLNNCGIGDAGIQIICNALSNITSLLSLDISNNCIGNNSAVRIANVLYSNNELQHLNLTNCFAECFFTISHVDSQMQAIKNLSLENNQIDDHAAEIIKYVFICNSTVEYLNLSHCNMTETGLLSILSALETVKSLQFLNLTSNNFTKSVLRKLLSVIQTNINIKKLVFSNCKLPQKDLITYINLALSDTSLVQYIDFSCNSCDAAEQDHETSDLCVEHIVTVNESLEYFNLSHCNLSDVIMHEIVLVLQKCTSLTTLRLCSSTISSGSLLGSVITNNQSLEYLDLSNCKLQQEDIKTIADGLKKTNSCRFLLLNSNTINDTAAKVLASTISTSLSLTLNQLSLSNCKLDDKGILYIADALQWISSLQHLDLSYNAITDDAAAKISTGLSCNTALEYLNMSYCTWSSNGLKIIHKQLDLENFTNLREVDFSNDG